MLVNRNEPSEECAPSIFRVDGAASTFMMLVVSIKLHGVTLQERVVWILTSVGASNTKLPNDTDTSCKALNTLDQL
jgi:hypothetical protein